MRPRHDWIRTGLLCAALFTLPGLATAQTSQTHLGPHIGYNFDLEEASLGAQLGVPVARFLEFYPSFDWYLVDAGSFWAVNADLKLRVEGRNTRWLYLGGGLNISNRTDDDDVSRSDSRANFFIGAESLVGRIHPFVELRALLGNGSSAQLAAGLNFTLR
jgi:hypothetical protein